VVAFSLSLRSFCSLAAMPTFGTLMRLFRVDDERRFVVRRLEFFSRASEAFPDDVFAASPPLFSVSTFATEAAFSFLDEDRGMRPFRFVEAAPLLFGSATCSSRLILLLYSTKSSLNLA